MEGALKWRLLHVVQWRVIKEIGVSSFGVSVFNFHRDIPWKYLVLEAPLNSCLSLCLSLACLCVSLWVHTYLFSLSCIVSKVLVPVFTEAGPPGETPNGILVTAKSNGSIKKK